MNNYLTNTSLRELLLRFSSIGLALFFFSGHLFAGNTNLAWDASTSSDVGGYKISYGQSSGNYSSTIDIGNKTTYTVSGLQEGTKYYFAVKAYNSARTTESSYSNETSTTIPTTETLTADFTASKTSGDASLVVDFTPITSGTVTSWKWDFTGSYTPSITNSTAQTVTVTYPNPGTYSVSLTAIGPSGSVTKTKANFITVTSTSTVTDPTATDPTAIDPSNDGLVAAYGFEESDGVTVTDVSGNGNHGTIKEAIRSNTGKYGKALQFDGVNDLVTINDSDSLDLSTEMTLEAWVKPSTVNNAWRDVIYKGEDNYYLEATSPSNGSPAMGGTFDPNPLYGPNALPVDAWTHLAATYDGATMRLYMNGVQVASQPRTGPIQTSEHSLQIGGDSIFGQYFKGYIDEVRIYNRALTETEINHDIMTAIAVNDPTVDPTATDPTVITDPTVTDPTVTDPTATDPTATDPSNDGLVAAYGFEESDGVTVTDVSGNSNHGTIKEAIRSSTGKYGKALQFDGVNDLVTINDSDSLDLSTEMTLEAWVNPSVINNTWQDVIYKGEDTYYLEATSNFHKLPAMGGNFDPNPLYGSSALPAKAWTHLAATYDGATIRLYMNGVQVASRPRTGPIQTSEHPLQIGGDNIFGQYFKGYIDEVRIYNRALTETEINHDMMTAIGD